MEVLPKDEIMFRIIFGDAKCSHILVHFLNSIIKPQSPIKSVEVRQPEFDRNGICMNIIATTENSKIINVEILRTDEKNVTARTIYGWAQLFCGQLNDGMEYHKLSRTVAINILDFNLFKSDERYWRRGHIRDDLSGDKFTNLLEIHFIELIKMRQVDEENPLTFWIEFMKNPYSEKISSLSRWVPEIREAKEIFEIAKSAPEIQNWVRDHEKIALSPCCDIAEAKAEAKNEGKEEGIAIGKEEGATSKTKEIVKYLLSAGVEVSTIVEASGLSVDEIEGLRGQ